MSGGLTLWESFFTIMSGLFSLAVRTVFATAPKLGAVASSLRMGAKRKAPTGLPHVDVIEKVSESTVRVLGLNPGPYTLQGTNTYLIGSGPSRILVDTGEAETAEEYVSQLFDFVFPACSAAGLTDIVLTHGHADHQGGAGRILEECRRRGLPLPRVHKHRPPGDRFPVTGGIPCEDIQDGQTFCTEGATLRVLLTPGHCSDHASLILQEDGAVLSGDCVLGCGSSVFEDLSLYMRSLCRLRDVMTAGVQTGEGSSGGLSIPLTSIYPGHGPVIRDTGVAKVTEYISHREEREAQIVAALRAVRGEGQGWVSSWALMRAVYRASLPAMPLVIQAAAQGSTLHHLEKLRAEGGVQSRWPDLWRAGPP